MSHMAQLDLEARFYAAELTPRERVLVRALLARDRELALAAARRAAVVAVQTSGGTIAAPCMKEETKHGQQEERKRTRGR